MGLSREEVLHIAWLARLGLSEDEVDRLKEQLSKILDYFELLKEVDTSQVPPTAYPIPLSNIYREDKTAPSYPQDEVLSNAPRKEEGCFKVKAILEE